MRGTRRSGFVNPLSANCPRSDRALPAQDQAQKYEQDQQVEDDHTHQTKKGFHAALHGIDAGEMGAKDADRMIDCGPVHLCGKARMLHHLLGLRDDLSGPAGEPGQAATRTAQLFGECGTTDAKPVTQQRFQLHDIAVYLFWINHFPTPVRQPTATGGDPQ